MPSRKNVVVQSHHHLSKNATDRVPRSTDLEPLVIASQIKWCDIIAYHTPTTQTLENLVRFSAHLKPMLLLQKYASSNIHHPPLILKKPLFHNSPNIFKQPLNHTMLPVWSFITQSKSAGLICKPMSNFFQNSLPSYVIDGPPSCYI